MTSAGISRARFIFRGALGYASNAVAVRVCFIVAFMVLATLGDARADAIAAPPLNCAHSVVEAIVRNPVSPIYPDAAPAGIATVKVFVNVTVNADSSVSSAVITKSSGNAAIDQAAILAARTSTYAPKFINCVASDGGLYTYKAEFGYGGTARVVSCDTPYRDVSMVNAVTPGLPAQTRISRTVTVAVDVLVSQDGSLRGATVSMSSGDAAIDQAVVRAALASTYAPRLVNCEPTQGDYVFRAQFSANAPAPSASPR